MNATDHNEDPDPANAAPRPEDRTGGGSRGGGGRRWILTLVFAFLVPMGVLLVLAGSGRHQDPMLRLIGGVALFTAAAIVIGLAANRPRGPSGPDGEGGQE